MTPIVLIPGLLCTSDAFAPQVAALWPYGPVTVASTLQGSTIAEIAASILADCPPRFALAGISMGGYLALEIMRQAPHRVAKLALISTQAQADSAEETRKRRAMIVQSRAGSFEGFLSVALRTIVHPLRQGDAQLRARLVRMGMTVGPEAMERQLEAIIARVDSRADLPAIAVPTLVLVGDADALTPPARAEEMARAISGARLVVIPECGHASTLERAELVNAALVEWLAGRGQQALIEKNL